MSTTRRFSMFDLLKLNNVNLDPLTETYNMAFYTQYLAKWPEYCFNVTAAQGRPMGYILGKAEGLDEEWHGHVTAVTVPPEYRRLGVAAQLMDMLERGSENARGYFVDISNPNPSRNPNPNPNPNPSPSLNPNPSPNPSPSHIPNPNPRYFVDLFVRESNSLAIGMYQKLGYSIYRQVRARVRARIRIRVRG